MKAVPVIYLDPRLLKSGNYSVKIKVTHNRKRRYYNTGIYLNSITNDPKNIGSPNPLEKLMDAKRRTPEQVNTKETLEYYLEKAKSIIKKLPVFTFELFEEAFLESRNISESVSYAFDKAIEEFKINDQIGTAVSYETAKNSIIGFKGELTFADVNVRFLKEYERFMLREGKSITTISMYLRSLRAVFNKQNIDKSIYPFGKGKYRIPTAENTKRALTLEEIGMIYNYEADPMSMEDMAKDYFIFMYLCNGMNVKDLCLLKWNSISDNTLSYVREKTKRTEKVQKRITVALKPETMDVLKKWGTSPLNKEDFIFPHLNTGMTAERQREVYQQVTKNINKYMKRIAKKIGLKKNITSYYARHSFATILQQSGANISMISDLLGHSSMSVTENYLSGFESSQIEKATNVLTSFKKK